MLHDLLFCQGCTGGLGLSTYRQIHDNIRLHSKRNHGDATSSLSFALPPRSPSCDILKMQAAVSASKKISISNGINKNQILDEYTKTCLENKGIFSQVTSSSKGEPTYKPINYPTIAQLVRNCKMKPSLNHQYRVEGLILQNIIVILLKEPNGYLSTNDIKNLYAVNRLFKEVISDVQALRDLDFSHFFSLVMIMPTNKPSKNSE